MFASKSGGLFDFNGDGEVSFTEKFLAYNIFEEITNADGGNCSSYDEDDDDDEYDDEDEDPDAEDISEGDDEDDDEDDDEPAPAPAPAPAENPAPAPAENPAPASQNMEVYTICGVALRNVSQVYHYMCGDLCLQIGDTVRVPAGENELTETVVSVGQYMGWAAPFPVEKMKKIIKKL